MGHCPTRSGEVPAPALHQHGLSACLQPCRGRVLARRPETRLHVQRQEYADIAVTTEQANHDFDLPVVWRFRSSYFGRALSPTAERLLQPTLSRTWRRVDEHADQSSPPQQAA